MFLFQLVNYDLLSSLIKGAPAILTSYLIAKQDEIEIGPASSALCWL